MNRKMPIRPMTSSVETAAARAAATKLRSWAVGR